MENLKTLSDRIKKFYGLVETHNKEIEICVKETVKPCNSIVNQSSLLRAVIQENLDLITGFEELPGYKEALTENIFRSLEEEFHLLEEIRYVYV